MTRLKRDFWLGPAIVFALAVLLFAINLGRPPHPDELHHVLAAQHLLETGRPMIEQGEYWRGILFTWLVAFSYEIFGEGIASARIPAVLFVALVAPVLFLWVRRETGSLAAWITAILFISSPFTVEIAQFSRFYSLQVFAFATGAACAYYAMASGQTALRRVLLGALAIALMALATWLQFTTLLGLAGLGVWVLGVLLLRNPAAAVPNLTAWKAGLIVLVLLVGVAVVLATTQSDDLEWAWLRYRTSTLFAAKHADDFWFYHLRYFLFYPTLWTLVGLLSVCAVLRSPRLAWLGITVFGVSFLLASFAAQKETRYLCFAQPFLAIVWGLGLAQVVPGLQRFVEAMRLRLQETLALKERIAELAGRALVVLALAIVILMNPFWLRTATVIGNVALPFETPTTDWRSAREVLTPWMTKAEIVITTEELGAIYFLGRSDVRFSPNKLAEISVDQRFEFGIDHRIGRPIIAKPESLEKLMECFRSGIIVGPSEHWGSPILVDEAVQVVIRRHATQIGVPKESHLYAWGWSRPAQVTKPAYCADLERFSGLREIR